jgi:hypothetical protein
MTFPCVPCVGTVHVRNVKSLQLNRNCGPASELQTLSLEINFSRRGTLRRGEFQKPAGWARGVARVVGGG